MSISRNSSLSYKQENDKSKIILIENNPSTKNSSLNFSEVTLTESVFNKNNNKPFLLLKEIFSMIENNFSSIGKASFENLKIYSFYGRRILDDSDLLFFLDMEEDNRILFFCQGKSQFNYSGIFKCFKIIKKIGEGGFGKIYLIKQRFTYKEYALKILKRKNIEVGFNFKEIDILQKIDHKNIIKLINYGQLEQNELFLVLEYLNGGSLRDLLCKKGILHEDICRIIIKQVLEALDYCHKKNIAHMDLKPENILFVKKDSLQIKLIDFGISSFISQKCEGISINYQPPEWNKKNYRSQSSADIFSLGCILFEMLTGKVLLKEKKLKTEEKEFNLNLYKEISEKAIEFIEKSIVEDVKQRALANYLLISDWILIDNSDKKTCGEYEKKVFTEKKENSGNKQIEVGDLSSSKNITIPSTSDINIEETNKSNNNSKSNEYNNKSNNKNEIEKENKNIKSDIKASENNINHMTNLNNYRNIYKNRLISKKNLKGKSSFENIDTITNKKKEKVRTTKIIKANEENEGNNDNIDNNFNFSHGFQCKIPYVKNVSNQSNQLKKLTKKESLYKEKFELVNSPKLKNSNSNLNNFVFPSVNSTSTECGSKSTNIIPHILCNINSNNTNSNMNLNQVKFSNKHEIDEDNNINGIEMKERMIKKKSNKSLLIVPIPIGYEKQRSNSNNNCMEIIKYKLNKPKEFKLRIGSNSNHHSNNNSGIFKLSREMSREKGEERKESVSIDKKPYSIENKLIEILCSNPKNRYKISRKTSNILSSNNIISINKDHEYISNISKISKKSVTIERNINNNEKSKMKNIIFKQTNQNNNLSNSYCDENKSQFNYKQKSDHNQEGYINNIKNNSNSLIKNSSKNYNKTQTDGLWKENHEMNNKTLANKANMKNISTKEKKKIRKEAVYNLFEKQKGQNNNSTIY